MNILVYNIYNGGLDPQSDPERPYASMRMQEIVAFIRLQAPDVCAFTELNHWTASVCSAAGASWNHPFSVMMEDTNHAFRLGITSKHPLTEIARISKGFHHGFLVVRIDVSRCGVTSLPSLTLGLTHLNPFSARERLDETVRICDHVAASPGPWMVTGDLNSLSPRDACHYDASGAAARFAGDAKLASKFLDGQGTIDYQVLDRFERAGLLDTVGMDGRRLESTVPTGLDVDSAHATPMRLDYALGNAYLLERAIVSSRVLDTDSTSLLSDHYPLLVSVESDAEQGPRV